MKLPELTRGVECGVRKRLRHLFNQSDAQSQQSGKSWYKSANKICLKFAMKYDYAPEVVANVLSALSPRNKWERNIIDCENVLKAVRLGMPPEQAKVCTFNTNKFKAFDFARSGSSIKTTSPKTFAFVRNIAELDDTKVTIDVWHLRACFGETIETGLTPKKYKRLEAITIQEAKKVGLKGYEFQAIVWEVIRNL